jgi:hypothetical protein
VASSKYDPSEFVVPPSLGKDGKSERIQCYVQAGHIRALNIVGRCGVFPFDEKNDVIRWCIKVGLERLNQLEPHLINSHIRRANIMIAHARDQVERSKFVETFNLLRESVNAARSDLDREGVLELYYTYKKQIDAMPNVPDHELRWKMKYEEELAHFKHLEGDEGNQN